MKPLRDAVCAVRMTPTANEDAHSAQLGIYEKASTPKSILQLRAISIY